MPGNHRVLFPAVWTGLEPAASAVTGRHSNRLNYQTSLQKRSKGTLGLFTCAIEWPKNLLSAIRLFKPYLCLPEISSKWPSARGVYSRKMLAL